MKITKSQLRRLIKEELQKLDEVTTAMKIAALRDGRPHPGSSPPPPGHPSRSGPQVGDDPDEDPHGDDAEQERGFIDGYYGEPRAEDATADYDIGHDAGQREFDADEERGTNRGPEDILGHYNV